MRKLNKIYKYILAVLIIGYIAFTLINQQQTLNKYSEEKQELETKIATQQDYKEDLTEQKNNVDSLEFIEQTAREKLDMYLPNEKIFVDQGM